MIQHNIFLNLYPSKIFGSVQHLYILSCGNKKFILRVMPLKLGIDKKSVEFECSVTDYLVKLLWTLSLGSNTAKKTKESAK